MSGLGRLRRSGRWRRVLRAGRTRRGPPARLDPEGGVMAVVLAMSVVTLLTTSVAIVFQVASTGQRDAAFRRQQAQSLDAAEAGLNLGYEKIQQAATASLPCGPGAVTQSFATIPTASSFSDTVTYYSTYPPTGSALACSAVHTGATLAAATIVATGLDGGVNQYMEALVKLSVTNTGPVFDQAMFSNSNFSASNNTTIYAYTGTDANLYTNANVACANNFTVQGSVVVQGTFAGSNNCSVSGNLTSVGNITLSNNAVIGGNATSTGNAGCSGSQGNITMSNSATVNQSAYAYCSITLSNNATVVHSKVPNDTTLTNPATETFPTVPEPTSGSAAATAWSAAGYTNQITDNTCTPAGVYNDISAMSTATAPTVVMTSCALSWSNNTSISLNQNLAIFSTGGFSMTNNTTWQSATSATRLLYVIVPSVVGSTTTTCSSGQPGISLANNTTFASSVNVMLYTPCTVSVANGSTGYGQVYGGVVSAANNYTAHYVPVPAVPGSTGGGSATTTALTLAVVYERQIASLAYA